MSSNGDRVDECLCSLAERVAKLEVGRAELHDRCDSLSDAIGSLEQAALRPTREDATGQLASAGEATVPTGWKLAPGWRVAEGEDCGCDDGLCTDKVTYVNGITLDAAARHCAVEMGALVRDEPPAEQPSRQETPGGETGCKPWCGQHLWPGKICYDINGNDPSCYCVHNGAESTAFCSPECLDRAKAKAAERTAALDAAWYARHPPAEPSGAGQVPSAPVVDGDKAVACLLKIECEERGDATSATAEPVSAADELPSAPVGFRVVGRSGPGVRQQVGLWIRRSRDMRTGEAAMGEVRRITSPSLGGVWDAGEYDILEPIAEPPAPAVGPRSGFDWRPLGCGETSRSSRLACAGNDGGPHDDVCDLVTEALEDQHHRLGAQVAALTARLAQAELFLAVKDKVVAGFEERCKEADAKLAQAERERDEFERLCDYWNEINLRNGELKAEAIDEATAKERERCLAQVADAYHRLYNAPDGDVFVDMGSDGFEVWLRSGAPAPKCDPDPPREVAPDRTQQGGGRCDGRCPDLLRIGVPNPECSATPTRDPRTPSPIHPGSVSNQVPKKRAR